jgi:hypothetical protein
VARVAPALVPDARDLLSAFSYLAIDEEVVEAAMHEPGRALRSLDAIHLAPRASSPRILMAWLLTTPASLLRRVTPGCQFSPPWTEDRTMSRLRRLPGSGLFQDVG